MIAKILRQIYHTQQSTQSWSKWDVKHKNQQQQKHKKWLSICLTVYATTAANPRESSYACYYDDERQTYLGDWYSVNWMEDSDMVGY